jgi:hypothetical protein
VSGTLLSQKEMVALGRLFGALRPSKLASVKSCEIFSAGIHRGNLYTTHDLDDMVANFRLARGRVDPPLSVGHEEDQSLLDNTGLPAAGWVTRLYRRGAKLMADFGGIPRSIAKLVNARAYRKVSAEVYDEPPEGAPPGCSGRMLRRVALLGAELPQIKSLADLPLAEYAEPFARGESDSVECRPWVIRKVSAAHFAAGAGRVTYFAEAGPMDRATLETQLKGVGYSDSTIEALKPLSDDEFAAFVLAALSDETAEAQGKPPPEPPSGNADAPPPEQMIADLVALGYDEAELAAMTPEELLALWQQEKGTPMSDTTPAPAVPTPAAPAAGAAAFAESVWKLLRPRLAAEMLPLRKSVKAEREARLAREREDRHAAVRSFCERMVAAHKLTPAEAEFSRKTGEPVGPVAKRLLRADAVRKYAEQGGKTDLQLQMEEVEARQPQKFGERIADPAGGQSGQGLTPERRKQLMSHTPLDRAILRGEAKKN